MADVGAGAAELVAVHIIFADVVQTNVVAPVAAIGCGVGMLFGPQGVDDLGSLIGLLQIRADGEHLFHFLHLIGTPSANLGGEVFGLGVAVLHVDHGLVLISLIGTAKGLVGGILKFHDMASSQMP